jgi:hypothetical protein
MAVLILGIDALDAEKVAETGILPDFRPQELYQDFNGPNALYTWRVWPSIFAGEVGSPGSEPFEAYEPANPYLWERYPATVLLAPAGSTAALLGAVAAGPLVGAATLPWGHHAIGRVRRDVLGATNELARVAGPHLGVSVSLLV